MTDIIETIETHESKVDALQQAANFAAKEYRRLCNERSEERRIALRDYERVLEDEVLDPKYAEALKVARSAQYEAERLLREARDAQAIEDAKTAKWPIGTRFVEWEVAYARGPWKPKRSGQVAIIEMFLSTSVVPDNVSYGKPYVGELVLRVLKKDGKPSARYIKASRNWANNELLFNPWFPEGLDPNTPDPK